MFKGCEKPLNLNHREPMINYCSPLVRFLRTKTFLTLVLPEDAPIDLLCALGHITLEMTI